MSKQNFYGKEDSYSRTDFLLISPGLAREWVASETYVLTLPNWGVGSDHRPIVATFEAEDSRIDFLLISPGLAREWVNNET